MMEESYQQIEIHTGSEEPLRVAVRRASPVSVEEEIHVDDATAKRKPSGRRDGQSGIPPETNSSHQDEQTATSHLPAASSQGVQGAGTSGSTSLLPSQEHQNLHQFGPGSGVQERSSPLFAQRGLLLVQGKSEGVPSSLSNLETMLRSKTSSYSTTSLPGSNVLPETGQTGTQASGHLHGLHVRPST